MATTLKAALDRPIPVSHAKISFALTQNISNITFKERAAFWALHWQRAKSTDDYAGTILARLQIKQLVIENFSLLPEIHEMYIAAHRQVRNELSCERLNAIKKGALEFTLLEISRELTQNLERVLYKERMTHWLYRLGMAIRRCDATAEMLAFNQMEALMDSNIHQLQEIYHMNVTALDLARERQALLDAAEQGDGKLVSIGAIPGDV